MAINIVETIQKNLGLPELQKIDPNTQEVKHPENTSLESKFYQAAVPTVLVGLYKYTRFKAGNTQILFNQTSGRLMDTIFGDSANQVVSKVANYSGMSEEYTAEKMETVAVEAVNVLKSQFHKDIKDEDVRAFFSDQRSTILKYVPAELKIGDVLNDETIDDRTNKMEGPMSSHMHWIEKLFSSSDPKKEENW